MNKRMFWVLYLLFALSGSIFLYQWMVAHPPEDVAEVATPRESVDAILLGGTAWTELDASGNATETVLVFSTTTDRDPYHEYPDFTEYLHDRPGQSGYFDYDGELLTLYATPDERSLVVYADLRIDGDVLVVRDTSDNTEVRYRRIR